MKKALIILGLLLILSSAILLEYLNGTDLNKNVYISDNLGISFESYVVPDPNFEIYEEDNSIYFYSIFLHKKNPNEDMERYVKKYISVFEKEESEDFYDSVTRIISNYGDIKYCVIKPVNKYNGSNDVSESLMDKGYETLEVSTNYNLYLSEGNKPTDISPCTKNSTYLNDTHNAFFIYNPETPTKFVFVNEGQDTLTVDLERSKDAISTIKIF